ncbi:hypothetical protein QM616_24650 [Rhodococcus fascians]|uniref:hypothetical protein n=1 Tax=Rhodococcoides fascians TaxID=1828 RepID=UPI0024B76BC0|nr:hypothetical protein [Rhodococcus fascians]MDJ0005919.1 hypothetical protein [Rhodococcus fascians]
MTQPPNRSDDDINEEEPDNNTRPPLERGSRQNADDAAEQVVRGSKRQQRALRFMVRESLRAAAEEMREEWQDWFDHFGF